MRRTTTRLALAAGAGASAVLLTAGSALATTPPDDWSDRFTEVSGFSGVSCLVSTIPGGESSVFISEGQWSPLLQGDNEFVGIGLELANGTAEESPFLGYGEEHIYSSSDGQGIERAVVCQGSPSGEGDVAPVDPQDEADEDAVEDATDDDATDEDADDGADDEDGDDATDGDDEDAKASDKAAEKDA